MKPNHEQAQAAFAIVDRSLSGLDCKGLTLVQARDLIAAMQLLSAYIAPEPQPTPVVKSEDHSAS